MALPYYGFDNDNTSSGGNYVKVTCKLFNNGKTWNQQGFNMWTECNGERRNHGGQKVNGNSITVSDTYYFSTSTSARTVPIKVGGDTWGSWTVGGDQASRSITIPATAPSVTVPPVVTNQKAVLSGSTVTISWINNGSGTSTPTSNYVDVRVDDEDWKNILNKKATSTTYSVSANHKYEFRVNSYNSAGQSTHQATNTIYTAPVTPTVVNPVSVILPSAGSFNFSANNSDTLYPSDKVEWQYSTNGGSSWSSTQTAIGTTISVSSSDSTLNSFIMGMKNNDNCYVRIRIYNYDNSIASSWSTAAKIKVNLQPICYVNIPAGATIKAIYINKG